MNAKIRDAQLGKIPYMLVIGDREVEEETVALRKRNGKRQNGMPATDFMALVKEIRPTQCTLVPDADGQLTSDHGFDLKREGERGQVAGELVILQRQVQRHCVQQALLSHTCCDPRTKWLPQRTPEMK